MKTIIYSLAAIFLALNFPQSSIAQSNKSRKLFKDAEKQYDNKHYHDAINTLEEIVSSDPGYFDARFLLGRSYYFDYNFAKAKEQFEILTKEGEYKNDDVRYMLAMCFKAQGEYELAKPQFEEYTTNTINANMRRKAELELEGVKVALESGKEVEDFGFQNAGEQLNTEFGEHAVTLLGSPGKIILSRYTSSEKKNSDNIKYQLTQFWIKVNDGDEFDFLNTAAIDGSGTVDKEQKNYYFTQCEFGEASCQIMCSERKDGIWQKATLLAPSVFTSSYNYKDPKLSEDDDTLFFSSDKRGGLGGYDIWYSVKDDQNQWSEPINLGEPVNTRYDEVAPFIDEKGVFYFSSNGHPGYGLYDIFYAKGLNGDRTIHNLGLPFNSSLDDLHFNSMNGSGLLVSNRTGGFGDFDVYTFKDETAAQNSVMSDAELNREEMEQLYSILFSSKLYDLHPKFIGDEFDDYSGLNYVLRKDLDNKVNENYGSLTPEKISNIVENDKILMASLSRDARFFVERLAAAYFENEKSLTLELSDEDQSYYESLNTDEKRKLYRLTLLTVNDLKGGFDPVAKFQERDEVLEKTDQEPEMTALSTFKTAGSNQENVQPESNDTQNQEETNGAEIQKEEEPKVDTAATEMSGDDGSEAEASNDVLKESTNVVTKKEMRPEPVEQGQQTKDEKFTNYLGIVPSVEFYQKLSFSDKKRVDRIMAIRLVNEKYTLSPGLSYQDRIYYDNLPQNEKAIVDRLKLYFRSWSKNKELSNLRSSDLNYLSSLEPKKRETIARIIVRRGIGVDDDQFIKFNGGDWARYKNFSEKEVENIKAVAVLLKEHDQFFDVALAYAGSDYTFNNNLASAQANQTPVASYSKSSDPEISVPSNKQKFESIYFDPGEYKLRKEALVALNELVEIYSQNPEISVSLDAYSYENGNEADNLKLSGLRNQSAKNYLVRSGIPDFKIQDHVFSYNEGIRDMASLTNLIHRKLDLNILNSPNIYQSRLTTYMVQPGNTLYSLSKANGLEVEQLMALNGLNDHTIYAYQPLRVKADATLDPDFMVNKSGEYVSNGKATTVNGKPDLEPLIKDEEMGENELGKEENADAVDRGEEQMVINVKEEPKTKRVIYIVKKGDKIEEIASRYHTSVNSIMELNGLKKKKIKKGQKLTIDEGINP